MDKLTEKNNWSKKAKFEDARGGGDESYQISGLPAQSRLVPQEGAPWYKSPEPSWFRLRRSPATPWAGP